MFYEYDKLRTFPKNRRLGGGPDSQKDPKVDRSFLARYGKKVALFVT